MTKQDKAEPADKSKTQEPDKAKFPTDTAAPTDFKQYKPQQSYSNVKNIMPRKGLGSRGK